jgi:hypothetical protein
MGIVEKGGPTVRKEGHVYRCALCGHAIDIPEGVEPRIALEGAGGRPNQRVLSIDGDEIHRCTVVTRNGLAAH